MTLILKPARSKYHDNKRYQLWPTYLHDTYCIAPSFNVYIPSYNRLYILQIIQLSIYSYSVYTSVTPYSNSDLKITIIVIVLTPHPTAQPALNHSPGCHRASPHCYSILKKRCPQYSSRHSSHIPMFPMCWRYSTMRGRYLPRTFSHPLSLPHRHCDQYLQYTSVIIFTTISPPLHQNPAPSSTSAPQPHQAYKLVVSSHPLIYFRKNPGLFHNLWHVNGGVLWHAMLLLPT